MLEFICAIPMELGWAMAGATAMLVVIMMGKIGGCVIKAIKERLEDDDAE